jgi:2-polyprenyl-3-methyl-5-hydroxy-6-metoxy-1,4-benzoquinol methylase
MNEQTKDEVRTTVREQYGSIARSTTGASCCTLKSCGLGASASLALGYSAEDMAAVPEGANMGLGCGNPQAIAALKTGETVLDLGAGGGFDCFLAAKQVGPSGRVIGVDMTPDMMSKARANAQPSVPMKPETASPRVGSAKSVHGSSALSMTRPSCG